MKTTPTNERFASAAMPWAVLNLLLCLVIQLRGADVATTVAGPANFFAGTNFSYIVSVTNLGDSTASNIMVSYNLPAGLGFVSASGGGNLIGGGFGQVVFDRASSNGVSGTLTWNHVTSSVTNRLLLVGVSTGSGVTVSNITYGGFSLSRVQIVPDSTVSSEVWQLVNPPSGTNAIAITRGGTGMLVAGGVTFSGVDQSTPLSAVASTTGSSSTPANTISSTTNEIVFDNLAYDKSGNPGAGSGQTKLWSIVSSESGMASIKPGTNSVTMSWSTPNASWVDVAVSVKPAPLSSVVNWTIPTLASGAATNYTLVVNAISSGTFTNTVSSTAATADPNAANNDGSAASARVVTTVTPVADVVTAQSGLPSVPPLTNYTYSVTVSNQGPGVANDLVVTETLAPTLTYVSSSGGGSYLAGMVSWPAFSLAKGATANFTVTVRSPVSGVLTNAVASYSSSADPNIDNNDGSAPAAQVVTAVTPLQIANTSFGANVQALNWSHTVSPGSSRILIVGVSIDSTNATVNAATFNNLLPLTPIGQTNGTHTKVLMYRLLNPPVGTYAVSVNLNSAVGVAGGSVSFNGVNQTSPIAAFVGNIGTGTNASLIVPSVAGAVVIDAVAPKSSQPPGVYSRSAAQTEEWNLSTTNYAGAGSSSYGAATVSPSWTFGSPAPWAMCAVALNPATTLADVALSMTGPASVSAMSNLTCSIIVTNLGVAAASNLVVGDVLPAGATFVSASSGGVHNGGVVMWPVLTNFPNGARTNYTVTMTAPTAGSLTNIAYCTALTADPDPSNNNGTAAGARNVTLVVYDAPSMTGQWLARGAFQLESTTAPGVNCSIEASTNLLDWQILVTTNSGSGLIHFVDEDTTNHPVRFYRSRYEP